MAVADDRLWEASIPGRAKWRFALEHSYRPVGKRMVDLAGVAPGMTVLDVGTGIGEPAITAAARVGPAGRVVGIDTSRKMISTARRRASQLGVSNVRFEVMDAQALPFGEAQFDAVLSQLVLMFLPDPSAALEAMHHLLVPGGKVAVAVLGSPALTPMIWIWEAAFNEYGRSTEQRGHPRGARAKSDGSTVNPFRFSDPKILRGALLDAGFKEVGTENVSTSLHFKSFPEYVEFQMELRPDLGRRMRRLSAGKVDRVLQRAEKAAEPFTKWDGSIRLVTSTIVASASRR